MAALVIFAGCNKDKETQGTTLKASITQNQGDSKTSLYPISDTEAEIRWTTGDKILVSNGGTPVQFTLKDGNGSTNGTFINGTKADAYQECPLRNGDKLVLADEEFVYQA